MRQTVQEIARMANVSTATVSRVLNQKDTVRTATKEKVLKIVNKYGFAPCYKARSMRTKRTRAIAMVAPILSLPISLIVHEMATILTGQDYVYNLFDIKNDLEAENFRKFLRQGRFDGIFLLGYVRQLDELYVEILRSRAPTVMVGWKSDVFKFPIVMHDDCADAKVLTEHLLSLGHKDIAFITGPGDWNVEMVARIAGYKAALTKAGIVGNEQVIPAEGWSMQAGYDLACTLCEKPHQLPTALFCYSDPMAYGVLRALYENNIKVPHRISVAGIDNYEYSEFSYPPLTSMAQQPECVAQQTSALLLERIENPLAELPAPFVINRYLVKRASTGPCPAL